MPGACGEWAGGRVGCVTILEGVWTIRESLGGEERIVICRRRGEAGFNNQLPLDDSLSGSEWGPTSVPVAQAESASVALVF